MKYGKEWGCHTIHGKYDTCDTDEHTCFFLTLSSLGLCRLSHAWIWTCPLMQKGFSDKMKKKKNDKQFRSWWDVSLRAVSSRSTLNRYLFWSAELKGLKKRSSNNISAVLQSGITWKAILLGFLFHIKILICDWQQLTIGTSNLSFLFLCFVLWYVLRPRIYRPMQFLTQLIRTDYSFRPSLRFLFSLKSATNSP